MLDSPLISLLFWILVCFSVAALFTKRYSVRPLIVALILRSIYYLGIGPTLNILGALNVSAREPPRPLPWWPGSHCSVPSPCPGLGGTGSGPCPSPWTAWGGWHWDPAAGISLEAHLQGCCAHGVGCALFPLGSKDLCVMTVS